MAVLERVETYAGVERLVMARTLLGRPLYWTSVYRVGGVLVDSGSAAARAALERFLAPRPVNVVLATHAHEDHVGNHAALAAAEQYAPEGALERIRGGASDLPFYRRVVWGAAPAAPRVQAVPESFEVDGRPFLAVATPGHSADHVAYLDEEASALFSGDAFLGRLRAVRPEEDVPQQMESLRRLAALDPAVLYPAHGPVVPRPRAALLWVADHFDRLAERARELAERKVPPKRIRQALLGPEPAIRWATFGDFSAENLVRSLVRTGPAVDAKEGPRAPRADGEGGDEAGKKAGAGP